MYGGQTESLSEAPLNATEGTQFWISREPLECERQYSDSDAQESREQETTRARRSVSLMTAAPVSVR